MVNRLQEHTEESIQKIKNNFPFQYTETQVLYLDEILYKKNYDYYITIHDNENYRYSTTHHHLQTAKHCCYELNRFFKRNPFTYENINNFCKLNNIDLHIDGSNLPISGYAREILEFKNSNNEIIKTSWNEVKSNPERYKSNYDEILTERKNKRTISKEDAVNIIYDMQSKLDRPINSYDFRKKQDGCIGIRTVIKYWGEVWLMQKELGLAVTGKHASLLSNDECLKEIATICNLVYKNENRKTISYNDIRKYGTYYDARPYTSACKEIDITLKEYIESLGFKLQDSGKGFNHIYSDGERVASMYEYEFSNYLRDNGLIYNKDYFRDVKYKTLTTKYKGNMNCDYEIHFQGRIFYVELAGILGNVGHEKCYRENMPINSKSKEKYRLDLMKKRTIFAQESLEYYILLKSEMNEETYRKILDNRYEEVVR